MQALLLIDIQNDYFPGGAMELVGSPEAGAKAGQLLQAFRAKGLPVVHIQHVSSRPNATFFLPGTPGVEIHPCVSPLPQEIIIVKQYPNSFRETSLLPHLQQRGIKRLVIAGMMTHMCVDTTTRAATDLGFECLLAHDACATRDLSFEGAKVAAAQVQVAYLAALQGLFAKVASTDGICATI